MFRKITFVTTLVVAFFASFAHASLSETTYNKYDQSASLAAYQLFSPVGPYTGNYQLSINLNGNADACAGGLQVKVQWTDEQGAEEAYLLLYSQVGGTCSLMPQPQQGSTSAAGTSQGAQVFMIRPLAETAVYVSVNMGTVGTTGPSPVYNLSVNAIGFW